MKLVLLISMMALCASGQPFKPNLGPDLPRIMVRCGELGLLLRQASQWTPGRIDYREVAMTTESSAYGTVLSFPDIGFIGTGHLENEPEELLSLAFFLDGQRVEAPTTEMNGRTFRLERKSRVRRCFDLTCIIELKDGRLHETTTVHADAAVPMKLMYHFMHAWKPGVSAYAAGVDAEPDKVITGPLRDDAETAKKFYITQPVDWMAVYEPESRQFAVSRLLEAPSSAGNVAMIWNVPGTYRKYYLKCFDKSTVPAGFTGTWRMVTTFGASEASAWENEARMTAKSLLNAATVTTGKTSE